MKRARKLNVVGVPPNTPVAAPSPTVRAAALSASAARGADLSASGSPTPDPVVGDYETIMALHTPALKRAWMEYHVFGPDPEARWVLEHFWERQTQADAPLDAKSLRDAFRWFWTPQAGERSSLNLTGLATRWADFWDHLVQDGKGWPVVDLVEALHLLDWWCQRTRSPWSLRVGSNAVARVTFGDGTDADGESILEAVLRAIVAAAR
jgi:hypothetical protein